MKEWKFFNDECNRCGGSDIRVLTIAKQDGYAYDGDSAECLECGLTGYVSVEENDNGEGVARIDWKDSMKILNLYAGLGGNRKLWSDEHQVTSVELDPKIAGVYKKLYPNDELVIADAHEYLLQYYNDFDFIWSSPPCQTHSKMNKFTRHNTIRYVDGRLFEEILFLKHWFAGKWIVENVTPYYEPPFNPVKIGRHLFWSNFDLTNIEMPNHDNFINTADLKGKKSMMDWLGIHYDENIYYGKNHCPVQILRNCVHPKVGLSILNDALTT